MENKLKIAFVINAMEKGGAERVIATLSNYFVKTYEVVIITIANRSILYQLNPEIRLIPMSRKTEVESKITPVVRNYHILKGLKRIVKEEQIHILIGFTTTINVLTIIAALLSGVPNIISERNNAKIVPPNFFWRTLRNIFYRFSDCLVVQTEGNKDFYLPLLKEGKIRIIQNPISTDFEFQNSHKTNAKDEVQILSVGRLTENKAMHIALKALAKVRDLDWKLTIVGDGPSKNRLVKLCSTLDLEDRVVFAGTRKKVIDYYRRSDIFVFTSRSEGFPNSLMEAYYFGLACIATDCDYGPADIITDNEDGLLVPVDDIDKFGEMLRRLIKDKALRTSLSQTALSRRSRFELDNIADKWGSLMCELTQ